MGMQRQVVRLAPSGIVRDLPPDAVPENVFTSGNNVVFRDGVPVRVDGQQAVYGTPLHEPEFLINLRGPLVNYWVYPGRDAIGVLDGVSHDDITPTAGITPTQNYGEWTGGVLNGVVVLNEPYNNPLYWPGSPVDPCEELPGWPAGTKAKALRPFKFHLIAMNITDQNGIFSDYIMWSDAAEPGAVPQSWTPLPENQAGFVSLAAGGGNIVDGIQLRDQFIIFKDSSTWALQYVGGNTVFAVRKILETSGMLSPNCAVEIKGNLVVLTDSDVIAFDGQQAVSLIDKRMRQFLFSQLDPLAFKSSFVTKNWVETEVWICIPTVGNTVPNMALVWSREENAWGIRQINYSYAAAGLVAPTTGVQEWDTYPGTWEQASQIWDTSTYRVTSESILGAEGLTLQNVDGATSDNGTPIIANIQKLGLALGDPQTRKLIKRIWPRINAATGTVLTIRAGGHDQPNGEVTWSAPVSFTVGTQDKIDTFAEGRYLAIDFASSGLQGWQLTGFDVEFSTIGAW